MAELVSKRGVPRRVLGCFSDLPSRNEKNGLKEDRDKGYAPGANLRSWVSTPGWVCAKARLERSTVT